MVSSLPSRQRGNGIKSVVRAYGEVQQIKNTFNQNIKLKDLIAEVAAKKSSQRNSPPDLESAVNN